MPTRKKPLVVVTRKLPGVVETRMRELFETRLNHDDAPMGAAELVAAALREAGRAVVVGAPTFGKGSVQTVIELEDGSAMRLTVSKWFTRDHASVQGVGVRPDVPRSDPDEALAAALEVARGR